MTWERMGAHVGTDHGRGPFAARYHAHVTAELRRVGHTRRTDPTADREALTARMLVLAHLRRACVARLVRHRED
jgi:hypothetical protein